MANESVVEHTALGRLAIMNFRDHCPVSMQTMLLSFFSCGTKDAINVQIVEVHLLIHIH
jgi:hypothetical protein